MTISDPAPRSRLRPALARLRRFASDESGAVTTDWVVLTAAIVGMGVVVVGAVGTRMITLGPEVTASLSEPEIVSLEGPGAGLDGDDAAAAPEDAPADPAVQDEAAPTPDDASDNGRVPIRVIDRGPVTGRLPVGEGGRAPR